MKKFDISMLTVAVLLLGLTVLGVSQAKEANTDEVVAKVGDITFTKSQLYEGMKKESGKSVMSNLMTAELIKLEAADKGITVTDQEVDKLINPIKKSLKTEEKFQKYLKEKGTDEQGLREKTKLLLLRDKLIEQAYPVTEEQIKEYYEKHKDKMDPPNPTLEQARAEIVDNLKSKNRRTHIDEWLDGLKKKYHAEYFDKDLEKTAEDK